MSDLQLTIELPDRINWVRAVWKPGWTSVKWELHGRLTTGGTGWNEYISDGMGGTRDYTALGLPQAKSEWYRGSGQPDANEVIEFVTEAITEALDRMVTRYE